MRACEDNSEYKAFLGGLPGRFQAKQVRVPGMPERSGCRAQGTIGLGGLHGLFSLQAKGTIQGRHGQYGKGILLGRNVQNGMAGSKTGQDDVAGIIRPDDPTSFRQFNAKAPRCTARKKTSGRWHCPGCLVTAVLRRNRRAADGGRHRLGPVLTESSMGCGMVEILDACWWRAQAPGWGRDRLGGAGCTSRAPVHGDGHNRHRHLLGTAFLIVGLSASG